jgi:hypothetical protein
MEKEIGRNIECHYHTAFIDSSIDIYLRDQKKDNNYYCEVHLEYFELTNNFEQKNFTLEIEYDYFDNLFKRLVNIKYNELLCDYEYVFLDGTTLNIKISTGSSSLNLEIKCHNIDIEKRKLKEINNIFNELIEKLNINKDLIK